MLSRSPEASKPSPIGRARLDASRAATRARVSVRESVHGAELREASALFERVWGRTSEGAPIHSEVMRGLVHAGGCVTVAEDADGRLVGAAVLGPAASAGAAYSFIAATDAASTDRGIGYALKLRQRAWALERGLETMTWTFDPLVARNARFNLVKLGAEVHGYEPSFYGRMEDSLNGPDESDRLVAQWSLASPRARAAADGVADPRTGPAPGAVVERSGPDGAPMTCHDDSGSWCRVPHDIVALRRSRPSEATQWRTAVREELQPLLHRGLTLTHITRDGWYLLPEDAGTHGAGTRPASGREGGTRS